MARAISTPRSGRVMRNPQHPFQLRQRPWVIQPMLIAPVLPGETMKNLLLQARTITDPIKNRLIGWWDEYYFFYVKHRDLAERDEFVNMVLDPEWDRAAVDGTAAVPANYYFNGTGAPYHIDWVQKCLDRVIAEWFRDEPDDHTDFPGLAAMVGTNWLDSIKAEGLVTFPEVDVDLNADDTITVGEIDAARMQYEFLKQNYATDFTYEQFLQSYGVRKAVAHEETHRPELLRFVRNWQYPVSAIDPADGSAASAVVWDVTERADKDRFFKEPGFVFGVHVVRPKVYLGRQKGTATSLLDNAFAWLPAILTNDWRTSLKLIADTDLVGDTTDAGGAWVDLRDLFLYGEQFVNFSLSETDANLVAWPNAGLTKPYPVAADVEGLFTGSTDAARLVRTDGIVTLGIAGRQVDQT